MTEFPVRVVACVPVSAVVEEAVEDWFVICSMAVEVAVVVEVAANFPVIELPVSVPVWVDVAKVESAWDCVWLIVLPVIVLVSVPVTLVV